MRLLLFLLLLPTILFAQKNNEVLGIKYPGTNLKDKCNDYLVLYNSLPIDFRYTVQVEGDDIFFYFRSKKFFLEIFDKSTDGFAIDILRKEQYNCNRDKAFPDSWANRGFLMPPMFKKEILENTIYTEEGFVIVRYGKVPKNFDPLNIECNLIIVQKKYLCGYHIFSNLEFSNWDLLNMGMYRDSLSTEKSKNVYNEISKKIHFTVPFEKDKSVFEQSDIQPLYDSLRLTDYNIKEITIKAYTSVEGSLERNIELQKSRSQSIVKALQKYQTPKITSNISANENWIEFLNDIAGTQFKYLSKLSKNEIKSKLKNKNLLKDIEPILMKHRKALIELKLQKKFSAEENNPEVLKKYFDQSIQAKNIDEALYIQNIILEKIKDEQLPSDFISKLEVPKESLYGPLLNNFAIFNYESDDTYLYENILYFEKLLALLPGNLKIMYNLTTLKIKAWTQGELVTNERDIRNSIAALEKLGLEKSLATRLKVNYHIILTEYYNLKEEIGNKNRSLKEVYGLYKRLKLVDRDLLSLAKYLSIYSKFDWAEDVLAKRINDINVSEDLIFYYLKLTIGDPRKTQQNDYRKFILNAIDKNQQRFCDLFLPTIQGGYTFQLLNDNYLKSNYCENCQSENY